MGRHAILVITHGSPNVFARTLRMLDDPDIDFFIHVDRRTDESGYKDLRRLSRHSSLNFSHKRHAANWGSHRIASVTVDLLAQAIHGRYDRYHLVSGADLALKNSKEFKQFFEEHDRLEYVGFADQKFPERTRYYYFFQQWMRRGTRISHHLARAQSASVSLQRQLGVDRNRCNPLVYKGSTWFSISHELAEYVAERRSWMVSSFRWTMFADESFLQTMVATTTFFDRRDPARLHQPDDLQALRLIDWRRGGGSSPDLWGYGDIETIIRSDCLFARKFDPNDTALLDLCVEQLRSKRDHRHPE